MQMRNIPAREPGVNRVDKPKEVSDGPTMKIRPGDGSLLAETPKQIDSNLKLRPRHGE